MAMGMTQNTYALVGGAVQLLLLPAAVLPPSTVLPRISDSVASIAASSAAACRFAAAANILSSFPQDVLADLCHEVLDFLMYRVGSVDCDILQEKLAPAGVGIPTERAQGAINALTFTFRAAVQASLAHDVMNIGRLVSFNWKLGLSTESSIVKGLGRAFVAVEVKVVDSGANIQVHSFDMTLAQFQNFANEDLGWRGNSPSAAIAPSIASITSSILDT
eukprot:gene21919-24859_t